LSVEVANASKNIESAMNRREQMAQLDNLEVQEVLDEPEQLTQIDDPKLQENRASNLLDNVVEYSKTRFGKSRIVSAINQLSAKIVHMLGKEKNSEKDDKRDETQIV